MTIPAAERQRQVKRRIRRNQFDHSVIVVQFTQPLVLLCPSWKKWGTATTVKANTVILHSRADEVVPFENSVELIRNSGLPEYALIETGTDHRLADPEPLAMMLRACGLLCG